MKNEEFAAAIARGLCAAPLRDYASNACGKPALDGNFSSPPKLGGVPLRGGRGSACPHGVKPPAPFR